MTLIDVTICVFQAREVPNSFYISNVLTNGDESEVPIIEEQHCAVCKRWQYICMR